MKIGTLKPQWPWPMTTNYLSDYLESKWTFSSRFWHWGMTMVLHVKQMQNRSILSSGLRFYTWDCPVSSVDPPIRQKAALLPSLLGDCNSGPAPSNGRGWSLQLRPEKHSLPLWSDSLTVCKHTCHIMWEYWEGWKVVVGDALILSQIFFLITIKHPPMSINSLEGNGKR